MPKSKQKVLTLSLLALVAAQILWGINTPVMKLGLQTVPLPVYQSIALLGAALLLLPLALKTWKPLSRKDYMILIIGSVLMCSVGNVVLLLGLRKVAAVNAALIGLFGPLLLLVLSVEFLKERMNFRTFFGILIAFAGAAIIIGKPWDTHGGSQDIVVGNLLIILAMLCDVVGTLIIKSVLKRGGTYQITFLHLFTGVLPVAVFALQYIGKVTATSIGKSGFEALIYNIIAVAIANVLFMYALKRRKAQDVGIFGYIHPAATIIAAWFILAEIPDPKIIPGALLIFVGIYLAETRVLTFPFRQLKRH